jgi:hypothetical protein
MLPTTSFHVCSSVSVYRVCSSPADLLSRGMLDQGHHGYRPDVGILPFLALLLTIAPYASWLILTLINYCMCCSLVFISIRNGFYKIFIFFTLYTVPHPNPVAGWPSPWLGLSYVHAWLKRPAERFQTGISYLFERVCVQSSLLICKANSMPVMSTLNEENNDYFATCYCAPEKCNNYFATRYWALKKVKIISLLVSEP